MSWVVPRGSCSVVQSCLGALQPRGWQHTRLPCPSPSSGVCSNSCPLSESVMPSSHLILCHPLLLLPSVFPSISIFPRGLALPQSAQMWKGDRSSFSEMMEACALFTLGGVGGVALWGCPWRLDRTNSGSEVSISSLGFRNIKIRTVCHSFLSAIEHSHLLYLGN